MRHHKVKPLAGQLSLLGELPVKYCPICGRRLTSDRSHKAGIGPQCRRQAHIIQRKDSVAKLIQRIVTKVRKAPCQRSSK